MIRPEIFPVGRASALRAKNEESVKWMESSTYPRDITTDFARPSRIGSKRNKNIDGHAAAAGDEVRPLLDAEDVDPKIKAFGSLSLALLQVVTAIVKNGLVQLAGAGGRPGSGSIGSRSGSDAANLGPALGRHQKLRPRAGRSCVTLLKKPTPNQSYLMQIWGNIPVETGPD
jgi:hypothetical protein